MILLRIILIFHLNLNFIIGINSNNSSNNSNSNNINRNLKLIYFIRHGQAYNNIYKCEEKEDLRDPLLTSLGLKQVKNIQFDIFDNLHHYNHNHNHNNKKIELIIFSPLRRTIQTLNESIFMNYCKKNHQMCIPLSDLQENNNGIFACDTGHSPNKLQKIFPSLNFSNLSHNWMIEGNHLNYYEKLKQRHSRVRQWLSQRLESIIVVIAHLGTIQGVTNYETYINHGDILETTFDTQSQLFIQSLFHHIYSSI